MEKPKKFTGYHGVFATRLRGLMKTTQTTQVMLASQTRVARQTISQYMDGSVLPNIEKLCQICSYFNVPSDYLLGLTDSISDLKSNNLKNLHIQSEIGLSNEAMENLEKLYRERLQGLFPPPILKIDFFNYMLSNQNFMKNFPELLRTYFDKKAEDSKIFKRTKKNERSEETEISCYLLTRLMQKLADDCYDDFYKPLFVDRKKTPGRKRKEDVSDGNSTET